MIMCPKCGRQNQDGALRCDQCGTSLIFGPAGSGSPGFRLLSAQVDFSLNSPYNHLGGWLLVLTIYFAFGLLGALFSGLTRFSTPATALVYLLAAVVVAALVYFILTRNKNYLIAFYCYVALQLLAGIVAIPHAFTQAKQVLPLTSGLSFGFSGVIIFGIFFGLLVTAGIYVAVWFYFRRSQRVAAWFR